ncbi:MAG: methyltransferase domain-containing protein [Bryobacteraceae bacterium]
MSDLNFSLSLPRKQRRPLENDPLPQSITEQTRRVYDAIARVYPLSTYFFHRKAHAYTLEHSGIRNGDRVLEIAMGSGEMFRKLVEINPAGTTIGLDLAPNMAAYSQKRIRREWPNAAAHCGAVDVRNLPFADGSFDAIVCCYLVELLGHEDIYKTLTEAQRVLRPGGRFSLVVIGQNKPVFRFLYRIGGAIARAFWGRLVESEVPEMMRQSGLEIVKDHYLLQGYYPSRVLISERIEEPAYAHAGSDEKRATKP